MLKICKINFAQIDANSSKFVIYQFIYLITNNSSYILIYIEKKNISRINETLSQTFFNNVPSS